SGGYLYFGFFHESGSGLLGLSPDTRDRKAGEEIVQQYVLFPVWSSGSIKPQNTDGDTVFDEKELEFKGRKPESEVNVSPSSSAQSKKHDDKTKKEAKGKTPVESLTGYRNLSAEFEDFSDNSINEDNADGILVPAVGQFSPNSTNTFSAAELEDITYSDDEDDVGVEADFNNLETSIIEELLQFKMQKVWVLVDLPHRKRAIGTKWVFRNKKDERGIVVRNKARLVAQGQTHEEGIKYEEVFAPLARIEAIRLFLAYASFMGFMVYQMDVKSAFLYGTIEEEKINDVPRLQALVDKKRVIITEATIRDALRLADAEGRKFNFSKYIFDNLVRNVDSSTKFYMYLRFLQLMIRAQVGDLSSHTTKYSSPTLTHKVFANMRRVGKGCSGVEIPLFEGMIVAQQVGKGAAEVNVKDVPAAGVTDESDASVNYDDVPAAVDEPSILSPTPSTQPPPTSHDIPSTSQDVAAVAKDVQDAEIKESSDVYGRHAESQAQIYQIDLEHADKVLSMQDVDIEPIELQEAVEVVTTTKLITEVVTARVVIKDPEESATPSIIIHAEAKSKDKGKGILVEEPKPLKKQAQIEQDEAYARELEAELNKNIDWDEVIDHVQRKEKEANDVKRYQALKRKLQTKAQTRKNIMIYLRNMAGFKMNYFKGMTYDDIRLIFKKQFNSNVTYDDIRLTKEQMEEEDSRALKRLSETQEDKADEKQKLDEEVEELRKHLQIVPNDDDDVYTEATHLALKPDIQAQIWKNQRSVHGLAKVKSWKLLESCGVQIITFTTTQLILPEERKYPLTRSSRKTYQVFKTAGEKINAAKLN
nr:copia protein [Tanacetum cinerariifolium]